MTKALDEQPRAHEERHRQTDLPDHQRLLQAYTAAARPGAAFGEPLLDARAHDSSRGDKPREHGGHHRHRAGKRQRSQVQRRFADTRNCRRPEVHNAGQSAYERQRE